jgi:hypothetical protein
MQDPFDIVRVDITKYGHEFKCPLGLWAVSAPTCKQAEREARHYFAQYLGDGEYDKILANNPNTPMSGE